LILGNFKWFFFKVLLNQKELHGKFIYSWQIPKAKRDRKGLGLEFEYPGINYT